MIACFPEIYEDELLYSVLARYHLHSGSLSYRATAGELYRSTATHPDAEFVNALSDDALDMLCRQKPFEEIIELHTMYPAYARFIPQQRRQAAFEHLMRREGNWRNDLAIPNTGVRPLRYCPCCVKEDRVAYGETYWHRKHQVQRIRVCPKHGCYLVDSSVQINGKTSPDLHAAELNVTDIEPKACEDVSLLRFTSYLLSVMEAPVDRENKTAVGVYLNSRLDSRYRSASGLVRKVSQLYEDYLLFFRGSPVLMTQTQLKKVCNGFLFDSYFICQLAYFEGIPVKELTALPEAQVRDDLRPLLKRLSEELEVQPEKVEKICDAVLKFSEQKSRVQMPSGVRSRAWDELDARLFPQVKQAVDETICSEGRPVKISVSKIRQRLNLPEKQLYKLPRCMEYIQRHMETQPEYWAREVSWAIHAIRETGRQPSWNRINRITNMRRENFLCCLRYIRNEEISAVAEEIAEKLRRGQ